MVHTEADLEAQPFGCASWLSLPRRGSAKGGARPLANGVDHKQLAKPPADVRPNGCPYMHGSVYAAPFPGYVHGKAPVCPNKCRPSANPALPSEQVPLCLLVSGLLFVHKERVGNCSLTLQ